MHKIETVEQLIASLSKYPPITPVRLSYDGLVEDVNVTEAVLGIDKDGEFWSKNQGEFCIRL